MKEKRKYKKRLNSDELFKAIINKQLEPFGETFEDVFHDEEWLDKYILTPEQAHEWMEWSVNFIVKNASNRLLRTKKRAKKEMIWINLSHGLKVAEQKRELLIEKFRDE